MVLPTFLVIGAMKAGTTALHHWLGQHPDVFVTLRKELNFFAVPHMYPGGVDDYAEHFADADAFVARGEASPAYAMLPMYDQVAERIAATVPGIRLVYCVRDPVERIVSNYLHAVALGHESRTIDDAVREDDRYLKVSCYATQLAAYTALFPASSIIVVTAEDLEDRAEDVLVRVCAHLGVDPARMPTAQPQRVHVTVDKQRVRPLAYRLEKRPSVRRAVGRRGVRGVWRRATRTALDSSRGELSPATRTWLEDQLRPEVAALLPWLPEGHDGWGLLRS